MARRVAAVHEHLAQDEEPIEGSPRSFGFVFAAVFAVVGLLPLWRGQPVRPWALAVAGAFLVFAMAAPRLLAPLSRVWMRVGLLLHHVVNPIVMGVLFYLVITPFGLTMRLLGTGLATRLDADPAASTYWISRRESPPSSMRNQF
jgi:predicted membrane metal-binding protein